MDNLNKNNEDNGDNKKTLDIDDVLEFPQNFFSSNIQKL